ncbi:hypothetical protein [Rhodosalinus sp.]|uniref:hypothetical protein n=1 Tax=Rhodosalinus sp. TaxID=2047741 RepID=UPI003567ADAD
MPDYNVTETEPRPYLYAERICGMDPGDVADAMADAFAEVTRFMERHAITPAGPPLTVFEGDDPALVRFRAGVFVSEADAAQAGEGIAADWTPGGRALHFTHAGPCALLGAHEAAAMARVGRRGLRRATPTWEVYPDAPVAAARRGERAEVYCALG